MSGFFSKQASRGLDIKVDISPLMHITKKQFVYAANIIIMLKRTDHLFNDFYRKCQVCNKRFTACTPFYMQVNLFLRKDVKQEEHFN